MHWKKWFSKRGIGAINLLRGRSKYFDDAAQKLEALARFMDQHDIGLVINTGDYTALGLAQELDTARELVEPLMQSPLGYLTVPGNHDIYVSESRSQLRFRRHFGELLRSELPAYQSDSGWPVVKFVGNELAVVAINSARPNPWPWRSNGLIPKTDLQLLDRLLQHQRLKNRFIFIITHYAPRLADGSPDTRLHGLINADALLEVCSQVTHGAILCGHVHQTYGVKVPGLRCPIYCAGSATMSGHEGLWVYECRSGEITATRAVWAGNAEGYVLEHDGRT